METFTDDTVVALASFLAPRDMLSLALSCERFGDKHGTATKQSTAREERIREGSSMRNVRQRMVSISLMEVAARTVLHAKWTDEEKNSLPRREDESWIGIYQVFLKLFRLPLQFDKLAGSSIDYVERSNKTKVCTDSTDSSTAICSNIMRAGKHSASFQVNRGDEDFVALGIMRPTTKNITTVTSLTKCHPAHDDLSGFSLKDYKILHINNVDCCLLSTGFGIGLIRKRWKEWEESELLAMDEGQRWHAVRENKCQPFSWEGEEQIFETSFKIGLVLDLYEGTLDVYKNDRRLGTMMRGLVGEYCWAITLRSTNTISVSIGR